MERRSARALRQRAPAPQGVETTRMRRSALRPLAIRGASGRPREWGRGYGVPGAAKNTGDDACLNDRPLVPAQAGTQFWMPAFAGMSGEGCGNHIRYAGKFRIASAASFWLYPRAFRSG
jgi:hypothetical protein